MGDRDERVFINQYAHMAERLRRVIGTIYFPSFPLVCNPFSFLKVKRDRPREEKNENGRWRKRQCENPLKVIVQKQKELRLEVGLARAKYSQEVGEDKNKHE